MPLDQHTRMVAENVHQITRQLNWREVRQLYPDSMEAQAVVIDAAACLASIDHQWDGEWLDVCDQIADLIGGGIDITADVVRKILAEIAASPSRQARREAIIFGRVINGSSYERFEGLTLDALTRLFDENLIDPDGGQNDSPTAAEFFEFMKRWPFCTAHGYIIGDERDDSRVSIEGLHCTSHDVPAEDRYGFLLDFATRFRHADEFDVQDQFRCYWS